MCPILVPKCMVADLDSNYRDSVVDLKICTLHFNVISVKTVLFLPQFHALPSFLVRHVHELHFHVLQIGP